jgi:polar amino acid transport system substrate-binding protein
MARHSGLRVASYLLCCFVGLAGCSQATPEPTVISPTQTAIATPTRTGPEGVGTTVTPPAVSVSAIERIRETGQIRIGVLYNYPPFGELANDGQVVGYEVEIMKRIAERWEVEPIFVQVTRQTRLPMMLEGQVDMLAAAMPHRRELEPMAEFSQTTFISGYTALVKSGSGLEFVNNLAGISIAAVGEDAMNAITAYGSRSGFAYNPQVVQSMDEAIELMNAGTVQAIAARRESLILAASLVPDSVIVGDYFESEPYAFAVPRGDTPLRDMLDLTLQVMASEGVLDQLFATYFVGQTADPFPVIPGDPTYTFTDFPTAIVPANSTIERLRRGEPLRVAGLSLAATPPLFDGQQIVDGFNRALINEMARRWNVPVTEVADSAGEDGLAQLQGGNVDLVVGVRPNKALMGLIVFSNPYYLRGLRLIHMRDVAVEGIGDLEAKPVMAAPPLDIAQDLITDNNTIPRIQTTESFEDAFEALTSRGVYALVGDEFALDLMAQADERIKVDERIYRPLGYVIAMPSNDPEFLALTNFTLQDMRQDGTLQRLLEQYFQPYYPEGQVVETLEMEHWPGAAGFLGFGGY